MAVMIDNGRWMATDVASGRMFVADTEAEALALMGVWRKSGRPSPSNALDLVGRNRRGKRTAK